MSKILYMHIGQPKTGTSALQAFLSMNRELLREKGVYYPVLDGDYAVREKKGAMSGNAVNLRKLACPLEQFDKVKLEYVRQIEELLAHDDKILLSSEGMWWGNYAQKVCGNLKALLGDRVVMKVIVYLRRQDDEMESIWNQEVKTFLYTKNCQTYVKEHICDYDYDTRLSAIAEVIGKENMIVKIYDGGRFTNGNYIFEDFLSVFGIDDIHDFKKQQFQINPSMGKNVIEIKRILNQIPSGMILEEEFRKFSMARMVFAENEEKITKAPSILSYEERKEILDTFEESNRRLGKEYFGMEASPFPALEQKEDEAAEQNIYEDIIRFFGELFVRQAKEMELLHGKIDRFPLPERVAPGSRVIVYGADKRGRRVWNSLKNEARYQLIGFVDRRWERLSGIERELEAPEIIFERTFDYILIAVESEEAADAIREYLENSGIHGDRIIRA